MLLIATIFAVLFILLWARARFKISSLNKAKNALHIRHCKLSHEHSQLKNIREQGNAQFENFRKNFPIDLGLEDCLRDLRWVANSLMEKAPYVFKKNKPIGQRIKKIDRKIQHINAFLKYLTNEAPNNRFTQEGQRLIRNINSTGKTGYLRRRRR